MTSIPWAHERRRDTRTTNVRVGIWLFLASEAMFFASLFSAYVLLRAGSTAWPDASTLLDSRPALIDTAVLVLATAASVWLPRRASAPRRQSGRFAGAALAAVFLLLKTLEYRGKLAAGETPAANLLLACWFTLTGVHAVHVAAGALANVWAAAVPAVCDAAAAERHHALALYWGLIDLVWLAILVAFYLS